MKAIGHPNRIIYSSILILPSITVVLVAQVEVEVADRNPPPAYHGQQAFAVQLSIDKIHGGNVAFVIDRLLADNLQDATLLLVRPGNPDDLLLGVPILRGQTHP